MPKYPPEVVKKFIGNNQFGRPGKKNTHEIFFGIASCPRCDHSIIPRRYNIIPTFYNAFRLCQYWIVEKSKGCYTNNVRCLSIGETVPRQSGARWPQPPDTRACWQRAAACRRVSRPQAVWAQPAALQARNQRPYVRPHKAHYIRPATANRQWLAASHARLAGKHVWLSLYISTSRIMFYV